MLFSALNALSKHLIAFIFCFVGIFPNGTFASQGNDIAYKLALSKELTDNSAAFEVYQERGFKPIWVNRSREARSRLGALFAAFEDSAAHGLPIGMFDVGTIQNDIRAIRTSADLGRAEGKITRAYLEYAQMIRFGVVQPGAVDEEIKRKRGKIDQRSYLKNLLASDAQAFFQRIYPQNREYARLVQEKERLFAIIARGGWGVAVTGGKLQPGDRGKHVVSLRNRLIAMGYLSRTLTVRFDADIQRAVQAFQLDHGLAADGIVGDGTRAELNKSPKDRLAAILVAMERERWTNFERGNRHVWVNLANFSAKIMNEGRVEFHTRTVVGTNKDDQRSPEFSDEMEHMVVNPTWHVPRSIAVNEYLPAFQKDPSAHGYLNMLDTLGQIVSRDQVDFAAFDEDTFPFDLKQPPSTRNALGLVKFMFPNRHSIYLHDTPSKSLFAREVRAFSHGCIRLQDPFDFGYALLSVQSSDPKGEFHRALYSGVETVIPLNIHIPVHLIYRTAITKPTGGMTYRRDIYGRDAKILAALVGKGVVITPLAR
jgi:murein L,D-transpeptidase YcbB/YkuD